MKLVTKKELLELLDRGAIIEFCAWGINPDIWIRLKKEDLFKRIHQSSFLSVRNMGILEVVKRDALITIYRKKKK